MRRLIAVSLFAAVLASPVLAQDSGKKVPVHKITQSKSYTMIDPIYTPIMQDDKPVGLLMIGIGIDVPDEKLRAETKHALPVLRDAYVRSMMEFTATSVRPWQQPNVVAIADRLQHATNVIMRREGAKILLAEVAMRLVH